MDIELHLSTLFADEKAKEDFKELLIKSLNEITINGQMKIESVNRYGSSLVMNLPAYKGLKTKNKYTYTLSQFTNRAVLDDSKTAD